MGSADFIHNRQEFTGGPLTIDEMVKLLSVFENPSAAENVRKALRFYMPPEKAEIKHPFALPLADMRKYTDQYPKEYLDTLLEHSRKSKSVLVVGPGVGGVLQKMVSVMAKGSLIVAVEGKDSGIPEYMNPIPSLKETCRQLGVLGAHVELFVGDVKSKRLIDAVEGYAPYDFVFVNGNKEDFDNYAPMGRVNGRVWGAGIEISYRE